MRFSVVIPSRLDFYPGSASNRDQKLIRAVNSVLAQTFDDYEIHVVADGCQKTIDIVQNNIKDSRLHLWKITQGKLWSGFPRNKGIDESKGEYIIYLDIDDIYGEHHLEIIDRQINNFDWVWYNDIRYKPDLKLWTENPCDIRTIGMHGTSNICHRRSLGVRWDEIGKYSHDYVFVRKLIPLTNFVKIQTPEYYVCHVPGNKRSGGYDI